MKIINKKGKQMKSVRRKRNENQEKCCKSEQKLPTEEYLLEKRYFEKNIVKEIKVENKERK